MVNSYNYKTFYTGTPKKLEECPIIYFYKKELLDFDLSLKTLNKLKNKLSKESKLIFCVKGDDNLFTKSLKGIERFSFDLIIYCSSSLDFDSNENTIIGYTVFSEPQKVYTVSGRSFGQLIISVSFNRNQNLDSDVEIEILNTFRITQMEQDFTGNNGYNFPCSIDHFQEPQTSYIRYTNKLSDLKKDNSLSIITDSGVAYDGGSKYSKLFIQQGTPIDQELYTNFYLGIYRDDIVLCKFNIKDGNFCISSLTKINKFKKPYDYVSGYIDISTISGCELMYYAYSYLVFLDNYNNNYIVHFLEDGSHITLPRSDSETGGNKYVVVNPRDPNGGYKYISDTDLIEEIKKTCITPVKKEPSGNYTVDLDRRNYTYKQKIGSWWELLRYNNIYYYLSPYGCISSTLRLEIINDRLFKTQDGIFFPIEFGHTYKYPVHGYPRDLTLLQKVGIKIQPSELWENLSKSQECFLDGLRRKPIRSRDCFPRKSKIIGSLYGMIFYIENGLLYCY